MMLLLPVIFGEPGTNGQHSFYQLLHQEGVQLGKVLAHETDGALKVFGDMFEI